jgi:hypothetical protein
MKRFILFLCFLPLICGCSPANKCGGGETAKTCPHILFIGNSYTYENDLPAMFADLAQAGGHAVETGMVAQGGASLADHAKSIDVRNKLEGSKWDFVVLQEQSEIPAVEQFRVQEMYPAARILVNKIKGAGGTPVFFAAWAHRSGLPNAGLLGYESMQVSIDDGYLRIARELNVAVAPVGYAWSAVRKQNPGLELWQPDGSHPSEQGTYLAACVFYAVIFRQSPQGLTFRAHVSMDTANLLQTIARDTVLTNPQQWNLR